MIQKQTNRKRLRKDSVGFKHVLPTVASKSKDTNFHCLRKLKVKESMDAPEILEIISNKLSDCCNRKQCFLKLFYCKETSKYSMDDAVKFFFQCREEVINKDDHFVTQFAINIFKDSIISVHDGDSENKKFKHEWNLHNGRVCFKTISVVFGISNRLRIQISEELKLNNNINANDLMKVKEYKDDTVHNYSHGDLQEIFARVQGSSKLTNVLFYLFYIFTLTYTQLPIWFLKLCNLELHLKW